MVRLIGTCFMERMLQICGPQMVLKDLTVRLEEANKDGVKASEFLSAVKQ